MTTTATVFGKPVETQGCTTTQMEHLIALGENLDKLSGAGTHKALLRERFGLESRKGLTYEKADEYRAALITAIKDAEAASRVARKKVGPYKITRSDFRGGHRYDVFDWTGAEIAHALPGITTALDVVDKPALLPWIARLTGDAFKREIKRVLIDEAPANVAEVRAMLLPLLDVDGYKMANEVKEKAGSRGTNAHEVAEIVAKRWSAHESIDDDAIASLLVYRHFHLSDGGLAAPDVYLCVLAIRDWFQRVQPQVLGAESMVACLHCGCAATLDLHVVIDHPRWGGEWILDIKTSGGVYESHALQTAFQAHATMQMKRGLHERHTSVYRRLRIGTLWVNADAADGCSIEEFDNTQTMLSAVQNVINHYRWKRSNSWRRKSASFPRNEAEVAESTRIVKEKQAARGAA